MAVISAPELNSILDEVTRGYLKVLGTSASAMGMGEPGDAFGAAKALADAVTFLANVDDLDPSVDFGRQLTSLKDALTSKSIYGKESKALVSALDRHAARFGGVNYSTLDTLLTNLNTVQATKWQTLQDPNWRIIFNAVKGGSNNPAVNNVYFEVLQGTTYTNALRKLVVGTGETAGFETLDTAKYCGGIPCVNASGITGSGVVTVTGSQYDPATQTVTAGKTWTVTVNGNGRFYLAVGTAAVDSLLVKVTGISAAAGITAGTIYAECERPAMRAANAQAGAATTITLDASASARNDFYNNLKIGHDGDRYTLRTITDYDGNTKIATVNAAWATNPTTNPFRILRALLP